MSITYIPTNGSNNVDKTQHKAYKTDCKKVFKKMKVMITVTVLMSIGFALMHPALAGRMVLTVVWGFHLLYFAFLVKTQKTV